MRLEIQLPIRIEVSDYHDFDDIESYLKELNGQIKVKEVGGAYVGIIYTGSLDEPENALMVKKIRKECKEDEIKWTN